MTDVARFIDSRECVFFDLFHTLTGLESEWSGLPPTSALLGVGREAWNEQLLERSRDRLVGKLRDPVEFIGMMARKLDPTISDERIREAARSREERFAQALTRIPEENVETLAELRRRGKRLCLISNADVSEAAAWPRSPLSPLFDEAIFSCDVGTLKPEPEIYALALERMGAKADRSAFVGDGGSGELSGARRAGLGTVMVWRVASELWPERVEARRAEADYSVERVPELIGG
jgi:putative hydrolase of the HAD superfamily